LSWTVVPGTGEPSTSSCETELGLDEWLYGTPSCTALEAMLASFFSEENMTGDIRGRENEYRQ
jgi:hypothetical protein